MFYLHLTYLACEMEPYKCNLNTYQHPPSEVCTMPELEQICKERLELYKIMKEANSLDFKPGTKKWDKYVESKLTERNLKNHLLLLRDETLCVGQVSARRNDHIAHWLLSLCYCQNSSLRYFFICCELGWFVMLFRRTKGEALQEFLVQNGFSYKLVTKTEKGILKNKLLTCGNVTESTFTDILYYKTKFSHLSNLVSARQVFLYKGSAYFPEDNLIFCVKNKLWKQFNAQLVWMNRTLSTNIKDDRVLDFLKSIPIVTQTDKNVSNQVDINLETIDEIAETHYPLCMKTIHEQLRKEHHLKYDCKMQYGVFLKFLGLSYEDAMEFWKHEFTQKMSEDWFNRKYAYLFKHHYGKVGNFYYHPYSCRQVLDMVPVPGQHHGCPFKHWDVDRLLKKCRDEGLSSQHRSEVKDLVINNKFQEACTSYYCVRHNVVKESVIQSPNEYFQDSYELENSLNGYFGTNAREYV